MPLAIVDFLLTSSSTKTNLQHLWQDSDGSRDDDSFQLQQRHRPKYEVKYGYICLVLGCLGGGVGRVCYYLFATNINQRILYEEDDHDFGGNQNPITVQLNNDETIKYGDNIMLFLIDANGFFNKHQMGIGVDTMTNTTIQICWKNVHG